ncbi:glycosyltransferase [Thiorhodovibrio frisius]|uniref:Glycosyl transferase n=1 Tax=Thiorhodovibrio frisius TaxID=631362 RepID=H8Z1W3_9GAMM|nr:glycosyltransferase [Thiorhodovibrio frisius]EIC22591.1 glycosyl transferase [Thiorhodovibrio frisius]WPL20032.1 Putative glycosyltransferase EpsE [Thiorhodovibrio frisius]
MAISTPDKTQVSFISNLYEDSLKSFPQVHFFDRAFLLLKDIASSSKNQKLKRKAANQAIQTIVQKRKFNLPEEEEILASWENSEELMVTIICTAFNHGKYIADAINGFIFQKTKYSYEIIIHDDASTDTTPDVILEYQQKYPNLIRPILQKENIHSKGKKPVLECLKIAKGKYIANCDGDDFWIMDNKIESQVSILENNSNAFFCYHQTIFMHEDHEEANFKVLDRITAQTERYEIDYKNKNRVILRKIDLPRASTRMFRNKKLPYDYVINKVLAGDQIHASASALLGEVIEIKNFPGSVFRKNNESTWTPLHKNLRTIYSFSVQAWLSILYYEMGYPQYAFYFYNRAKSGLTSVNKLLDSFDGCGHYIKHVHEAIEILNSHDYRNVIERKYFCIGRNDTGTTALKKAFAQLGFAVGDQRAAIALADQHYYGGNFSEIILYCRSAQVFQDAPFSFPETFKHLDAAYKNSKFVLTVCDDAEQWYKSLIRRHSKIYGKEGNIPTAENLKTANYYRKGWAYHIVKFYGTSDKDPYNKKTLIDHYNKYNQDVINYFKERSNDLLVLNLAEAGSYKKFVEFVGVKSPFYAFPHEK